jgi:predicted phosphodiesterase
MTSQLTIVVVSDTHNNHNQVPIPDGDIFIHCGDMTDYGSDEEVLDFDTFLSTLPHKHKLITFGNHERKIIMRNTPQQIQEKYFKNAIYVQDETVAIEGINFYLSPWANNMSKIADVMVKSVNGVFYAKNDLEMRTVWNKIPENVNVLVTHCPPYGILDQGMGCKELAARLPSLPQLRVHLFGHVHDGHGRETKDNILYVNAATPKTNTAMSLEYNL